MIILLLHNRFYPFPRSRVRNAMALLLSRCVKIKAINIYMAIVVLAQYYPVFL